jgi:hypothetical protein
MSGRTKAARAWWSNSNGVMRPPGGREHREEDASAWKKWGRNSCEGGLYSWVVAITVERAWSPCRSHRRISRRARRRGGWEGKDRVDGWVPPNGDTESSSRMSGSQKWPTSGAVAPGLAHAEGGWAVGPGRQRWARAGRTWAARV